MNSGAKPLVEWLRLAGAKLLPDGWLYLPDGELSPDTACLFVPSAEMCMDDDADEIPAPDGYPHEGLDTVSIEGIVEGLKHIAPMPTPGDLVEAFVYYLKFDAFLPRLGAPDPPPTDVILARLDREFFDSLGEERDGTVCRHEGCARGTVAYSVFCARHHFESVKKRPWVLDEQDPETT